MKLQNNILKQSGLSDKQLQYHNRGLSANLMAISYWFMVLVYFLLNHIYDCVPILLFSILSFVATLIMWHRRIYNTPWVFGNIVVLVLICYLTIKVGWKAGFQFILFPSIIFGEVNGRKHSNLLTLVPVLLAIVFCVLGFVTFNQVPDITLPKNHLLYLFEFNVMAALFGPIFSQRAYLIKTSDLEEQLEHSLSENEKLLHNILPNSIADRLKNEDDEIVERFDNASILFADIVDFTPFAESHSPEELVQILNGLFSRFDILTEKYELEKIKTIGDAYMVASGVPVHRANHAGILVKFALEMLEELEKYNSIKNKNLKLRIGVSSGPLIAGVIGKKKFSYDMWGDTVNMAARMETSGQASKVNISQSTFEILQYDTSFVFEPRGKVDVKGKGMIDMYFVRLA
ncbi:MAG: adenylate/guanylate cyclase domain-containing protein [Flavobacteriales bacterium]|nr:adenylate/guanylate cyclase domain-containing protein [Flavobacteriales bacterium]